VTNADSSDDAVQSRVRPQVLPVLERQGPIRAWIVDDTGFPKKGKHSVGLRGSIAATSANRTTARSQSVCRLSPARQACLSPISFYLPESWANDADRRAKAGGDLRIPLCD
jgi:SRSO17 transposase